MVALVAGYPYAIELYHIMQNPITISKESILQEFSNINRFFNLSINSLFSETSDGVTVININPNDIISDNSKRNSLSPLNDCIDKVGVYVFVNSEGIPVYIGKGGTSRKTKEAKDLKYRISQELRPYTNHSQNTLSKNIIDIESILQSRQISSQESIEIIKGFTIRVLISGNRTTDDILTHIEQVGLFFFWIIR